mmetsp:Transcript_14935/g.20928  ORF Transcript_14935/g.20928 Transcript_14935/m.20928 type:complete len:85 (+) Transcript_14935:295-549(+)
MKVMRKKLTGRLLLYRFTPWHQDPVLCDVILGKRMQDSSLLPVYHGSNMSERFVCMLCTPAHIAHARSFCLTYIFSRRKRERRG